MAAASLVNDINAENFETLLIEASQQHPVLIDFWAPWCGPCQSLGPILEKLTAEYAGAFTLAKINTDDQQTLAAQFNVRSLPTVMMIFRGELLDQFTGAKPEGEVRALLEKHLGPAQGQADAEDDAADDLTGLPPTEVVALLQQRLQAEPDNAELKADLVSALARSGEVDQAQTLFAELSGEALDSSAAQSAAALLTFCEALQQALPADKLAATIEQDPSDLSARYQLGSALLLSGHNEDALQQFLEIMRRDRQFQDDLGRRSLVQAFILIEDTGLVSRYRSQMTSLLF